MCSVLNKWERSRRTVVGSEQVHLEVYAKKQMRAPMGCQRYGIRLADGNAGKELY